MCTYLSHSKGAEETECEGRGEVLSAVWVWGLPWGFLCSGRWWDGVGRMHKHWPSTSRSVATEISLKVHGGDEGWLGGRTGDTDLHWERELGTQTFTGHKSSQEGGWVWERGAGGHVFARCCTGVCAGNSGDFSTSARLLWVPATPKCLALSVYRVPVVVQAGKCCWWWYQVELAQKWLF